MAVASLIKFTVWPTLHMADSYNAKNGVLWRSSYARMKKAVFFLPVNILIAWHTGFLSCMTRYRVS